MFEKVEQTILTRLAERLGVDVHVGPLRELERVKENRQKAPAVWVIYDGYRVGDVITTGAIQQVRLDWIVVVTAKSAKGQGDPHDARDEAGALAEQVLGALLGYHLGGGKHLHLTDAPGPEYSAGYCHVPLAFSCAATLKGTP